MTVAKQKPKLVVTAILLSNLDKNAKLVTFSYYIKNTLQEMKLPDDYKPTKNEEKENKNWFKMF